MQAAVPIVTAIERAPHSTRMATLGCTEPARSAGPSVARTADTRTPAATTPYTRQSVAVTPNRTARGERETTVATIPPTPIPIAPSSIASLSIKRRVRCSSQARRCRPFVTASTAASAKSSTAPTAARTVCSKRNRAGRRCGSGLERDEPEGRGGNGGVPAPTAVGGRRAGGTSSAASCVCRSNSSSLPESLFSTGSLRLPGCLFF